MNYKQSIDFLYAKAPMFQQVGKKGYKTGLENTFFLDKYFGFPHKKFLTIHVGGTNGKGSTSHLLASVLQMSGYKVGLYTSPHLKDFRERIKVDGKMISKRSVSSFVAKHQQLINKIEPSFFEITTSLAFNYFAEQNVDIAVIEVGLGGRLDCTNIISPLLSVVTNISLDHTDLLGSTIEQIAVEKAGIIKANTPVIVGETHSSTKSIFENKANLENAKIVFADQKYSDTQLPDCELKGICQQKNIKTVLAAIDELKLLGIKINKRSVVRGFGNVIDSTGLLGRWQIVGKNPTIIFDTGHNEAGISMIVEQLKLLKFDVLHIVFGMVSDKKRDVVLDILPKNAVYYFTKASIVRSLDENILRQEAESYGIVGESYPTVKKALSAAKKVSSKNDVIYVGGSSFVVADALMTI